MALKKKGQILYKMALKGQIFHKMALKCQIFHKMALKKGQILTKWL